ncbi:MAG: DsbA family protein [Aestuariivirga sp.]
MEVRRYSRRHAIVQTIPTIASLTALSLFSSGAALAEPTVAAALAKRLLESPSPLGDRSIGNPEAPVVMIEYASATCPHCAEFHVKVLPEIKRDFVETGKLRFIFREFPLDQTAYAVFVLARCLPEEKFFPAIDQIFETQAVWAKSQPRENILKLMNGLGMDAAAFEACLQRKDIAQAIADSAKKASADFNIKGTPAIFVNGTAVDGHKEYAEIKVAIEAALKK